jgi:hypothetical protein
MTILERLKMRTGETNETLLNDLIETAKNAILSYRFPYGDWPKDDQGNTYVEDRYIDLQFRMAMDLYNKIGAEGQTRSVENGITREYDASWISKQLYQEITPYCGVLL